MSPVQHPVSGRTLTFNLDEELRTLREQLASSPSTRTARTLVKNGRLRETLVGLAAGGELTEHSADGPITVHVLEGTVDFEAAEQTWSLAAGSLLALGPGVLHRVRSSGGGVFLLTIAADAA